MSIALIGSGNMATQLIQAFKKASINIEGVYVRDVQKRKKIAQDYGVQLYLSMQNIDADVLFLCVPDDQIRVVSEELTDFKGIVVHTSGSTPSTVFASHKKYGVFYPVQSMTRSGKINFSKVPLCITASDPESLDLLLTLATCISGHTCVMSDEDRQKVHLAAVMTNNFINHLVVKSKEYLDSNKIDYELIVPLLRFTLEKLTSQPYNFQQTGPAIRGDRNTIEMHESMLASDSNLLEIYQTITKSIIQDEDRKRN